MITKEKFVTYDDYLTLPDDGNRYEIIGGELLMTPAPNTIHQRLLLKLSTLLNEHVEKNNLGEIFISLFDVILSMTDVVQPDIMFISKKCSQIITKKNIVEAPDLVIEILSDSTAAIDRNQKKELYEKYGVKEYWMVNPDAKEIEQYLLQDEIYKLNAKLESSEKLVSTVIDGFSLPLQPIFEH